MELMGVPSSLRLAVVDLLAHVDTISIDKLTEAINSKTLTSMP